MWWLIDPFGSEFMVRALVGGACAAILCAVVGTWVVIRGMTFLGEAMAHAMLPGVAIAALAGLPAGVGAGVAAAAMAAGVTEISRRTKLAQDASIGLLYVGMLALGVIIVSAARGIAVDLTAVLFGDVLAMTWMDVANIAVAMVVVVIFCGLLHRPFVALSFDSRVAQTLGMRPRRTQVLLIAAVAFAIVMSYQAVGALLVVGFLVAPPAAALLWARRIPLVMLVAALLGCLATGVGLLASWHLGSAAGATIALVSVLTFGVSAMVKRAI